MLPSSGPKSTHPWYSAFSGACCDFFGGVHMPLVPALVVLLVSVASAYRLHNMTFSHVGWLSHETLKANQLLTITGRRGGGTGLTIKDQHDRVYHRMSSEVKWFEAPHVINHTHMHATADFKKIDTVVRSSSKHMVLVDIFHTKVTRVVIPPGLVPGIPAIELHHDSRFYSESQTWLAPAKQAVSHGLRRTGGEPDVIIEFDMNANLVWHFNLLEEPAWLPCRGDCHHVNSVQYSADEDMIYASAWHLGGFFAVSKSTRKVQWWFSTRTHGFDEKHPNASLRIHPCPGERRWRALYCSGHSFHSFQRVALNHFTIFSNCISGLVEFSKQGDCLHLWGVYSHSATRRAVKGSAYRLPFGAVLAGTSERTAHVIHSVPQHEMQLSKDNEVWLDPLYEAPQVRISVQIFGICLEPKETFSPKPLRQDTRHVIEVRIANHLWLNEYSAAVLSCNFEIQGVADCHEKEIVLPPFMGEVCVIYPERLHVPTNTTLGFSITVRMKYGASTTIKGVVTEEQLDNAS